MPSVNEGFLSKAAKRYSKNGARYDIDYLQNVAAKHQFSTTMRSTNSTPKFYLTRIICPRTMAFVEVNSPTQKLQLIYSPKSTLAAPSKFSIRKVKIERATLFHRHCSFRIGIFLSFKSFLSYQMDLQRMNSRRLVNCSKWEWKDIIPNQTTKPIRN